MIRGHQFNKVEMFGYTRPEDSDAMLKELIRKACALVEGLGLHHHLVGIARPLLDGIDVLAREARDDAVHERRADVACLLEPLAERLAVGAKVVLPQLDVLADAVHQVMSVLEDELAGHDDETLLHVAPEGAEAVVEQLRELGGIRRGRRIG